MIYTDTHRGLDLNVVQYLSSEPQFETEGIHTIQVVSKQSLVTHKAQILIQPKCCFVCDLSFQYNLWKEKFSPVNVIVYDYLCFIILSIFILPRLCGQPSKIWLQIVNFKFILYFMQYLDIATTCWFHKYIIFQKQPIVYISQMPATNVSPFHHESPTLILHSPPFVWEHNLTYVPTNDFFHTKNMWFEFWIEKYL